LSVTLLSNPADVFNVTVPLLMVILMPLASLACTVTLEVLVPSAGIKAGLALIVVFAGLNAPVKITEVDSPIVVPAMVPVMIAVPVVVEEVNIAV
jgi:hypothetical protein